jgi:YegS/Rv2252/BmrU family lipid kinase
MTSKPLPRNAALVVNAHSRKGQDLFESAKAKLQEREVRLIAAHAVTDPTQLDNVVRKVVADGAPMVIVGGGDGSMSGTVDQLVGTKSVFAVLPLGTANSFARTLEIPLDLDGAIDVIATGECRRIDLGMINNDYFVNAASIGLSPMIGDTVPHKLKRYLGRVGYLLWALRCSVNFRPFRLLIEDGSKTHRLWSTEVRILNGPYHGGVELSDHANVESGEIVIQAVIGRSRMRLALDWYSKFFKLRDRDAHTEEFRGKTFRLDTKPHLRISIDGEVLARTPVHVRIAQAAVLVAVPRSNGI